MMLRLLSLCAICLGLLAISACQKDTDNEPTQIGFHGAARPPIRPQPTPGTTLLPPDQGDLDAARSTPPPNTVAVPQPAPPQPVAHDYPYATPVKGKPGFVVNPYQPDKQLDVTGFPPGAEARDPETNKIFLVP